MVFTILLVVVALVAGILIERNNSFVGTFLVSVKNVVVEIVNFVKSLFAKKQ